MRQHRDVLVLTLDMAECLHGHEDAIQYLSSYTPFFDVIYTTTIVETLPLHMNYLTNGSEFSRAFLNLYEKIAGINPEDLPDWVLEHVDALSESSMAYLTKYVDFVMTQTPQFENMQIIDVVRPVPNRVVISAVQVDPVAPRAPSSPADLYERLARIEDALQTMLDEKGGWSMNGIVQDSVEDLTDDIPADSVRRGSTRPSAVAPT